MRIAHLVALAFIGTSAHAQSLSTDMVAHFTFDGDTADSGPSGFPVAVHGDPTFVPGINAGAIHMDGNDWLSVSHGGGLTFDLDDNAFSIVCFVRFADFASEFTICQNRYGSNASTDYSLGMNVLYPRLSLDSWYAPPGLNYFVYAPIPQPNQWAHVAMTYAPGVGQILYINGQVADTSGPAPVNFIPNTHGTLTIGGGWYPEAAPGDVINKLRGDIDDLRIYNRALNAADVRLLAGYQCTGDADRNGIVNFADITSILANFNASCP